MSQYYFTPDAINTDHAGFYGYAGGDPANGPGTLMGFVQQPGFTFGDRFAGIANVHVRPGIELRNPVDGANNGDIKVLTNWNLGAGVTDNDGTPQLAYRYNGEAPILTVRAAGNLDIKASISDGFFQSNDGAQLNDPPKDGPVPDDPLYDAALAAYQKSLDYIDANDAWNGTINLASGDAADGMTPGGGVADISKDPYYEPLTAPARNQVDDYYVNYQKYIGEFGDADNFLWSGFFITTNSTTGFLAYNPTHLQAPQPSTSASYDDYANDYTNWLTGNFGFGLRANETPSPILLPVDTDYSDWSRNYDTYITGHINYFVYVSSYVGDPGTGTQLFYAPFAPKLSPKPTTPVNPLYTAAVAAYQKSQAYLDANGAWNGTINLAAGDPADGMTLGGGVADISKDPYYQPLTAPALKQTDAYYTNYQKYIGEFGDADNFLWSGFFITTNSTTGFLTYNPTHLPAPQPGTFTSYDDYANSYNEWLSANFGFGHRINETPSPILLPVDTDYSDWSRDYDSYINGHLNYFIYVSSFVGDPGSGTQLFYAPFAPREDADTSAPPAIAFGKPGPNNSPSNMPTYGNATSLASATLLGGPSTSYRFVAGADLNGSDPLGTSAAAAADVQLDGHFAVKDTVTDPTIVTPSGSFSGKTLYMPTTIRTGTGDIDVASAGDIRWMDAAAPATIYTAGAPAEGTTAGTDVDVLRPSATTTGQAQSLPDMLVNGLVNPDHAGDIHLNAAGDIASIQNVVDADGSQTKLAAGASVAQYWWQWMQVGNAADGSSSSIDFANFHQGVMSIGGNVDVNAGGNVSELSVSLPTTWYKNPDGKTVTTVGGGPVRARRR